MQLKIITLLISSTFAITSYLTFIINGYTSITSLITYVVFILIGMILIYISVEDMRSMEIPAIPIYTLLIFLILLNILLLLFGQNNILLFEQFRWNPISNIYAGIVGASISGLIYFLSNKKGLGEGDIYLFAIMGLILGMERIVFGFYLTLISALVFAAIQIIKTKRVKNIHIPFVPFIVFGTLAAVLLHESYKQLRMIMLI